MKRATLTVAPTSAAPSLSAVTSSSPPAKAEPTTKAPQPTVLGPQGMGSLRLGRSPADATATGLIGRWFKPVNGPVTGDCQMVAPLKGAPGGEGKVVPLALQDNNQRCYA
ncbi:hypothetical protein [Actinoplanes sp. TFC3]|uniref:hypothetical protein n=1 Tax=Actinoplanes sp. TFC3 TaxID=1710355 RepID=UPI0008346075|nr:hypothetical protein [Actinoplanes sp. TFC3]